VVRTDRWVNVAFPPPVATVGTAANYVARINASLTATPGVEHTSFPVKPVGSDFESAP